MDRIECSSCLSILSSAPHSILVLDYESDIVTTFKNSLELAGYTVSGFTDAILALEHYRDNSDKYSMIISDIRMPNITDVQFAFFGRDCILFPMIRAGFQFPVNDLKIWFGLNTTRLENGIYAIFKSVDCRLPASIG